MVAVTSDSLPSADAAVVPAPRWYTHRLHRPGEPWVDFFDVWSAVPAP